MTRTRKVAGSVALSTFSQVAAMVVGLWLTRFILDRLGQHDYGVWLLILQALGYLGLADIGVVSVLPRQVAFVTGKSAAPDDLPRLVGETVRLVLWQTPVVALVCLAAWLLVPAGGAWGANRGPLAAMLVIFAVAFPLRLFGALLNGLQDLVFLGWMQIAYWMLNTVVIVAGLLAGLRMYALVLASGAVQIVIPLVMWYRLHAKFPAAAPRGLGLGRLEWDAARRYLASALWVSVGQVAQALIMGADVLIIGAFLGPAMVVPYVVTLKLTIVIGNLPVSVAHAAGPGLSQMRMGESRHDLKRATDALTQAVLAATGVVACVIVAVNQGFITWWLGAGQYAGAAVTLLGVAFMLVRHYSATVSYTVYSFGHERQIAIASLAQGLTATGLTIGLLKLMGLSGAPLAGSIAILVAFLPLLLPTLARETGRSVAGVLGAQLPFVLRIVLAGTLSWALGRWLMPAHVPMLAVVSLLAAAACAAVLLPVALRPPLREYVIQILTAIRARLGMAPAGRAASAGTDSA